MAIHLPKRAVVFVSGPGEALHLSQDLRKARSRISILYGENGWITYARGMAMLSERPFLDLRRAA
jgi:hypothetical protein